MTEITRENFTKAMREAVAEKGADYVYEQNELGCQYQRGGEPSCLIGVVLNKLGVEYNPGWEGFAAYSVLGKLGVTDEELSCAAHWAQNSQDTGGTWGEALEAYEKRLGNA